MRLERSDPTYCPTLDGRDSVVEALDKTFGEGYATATYEKRRERMQPAACLIHPEDKVGPEDAEFR